MTVLATAEERCREIQDELQMNRDYLEGYWAALEDEDTWELESYEGVTINAELFNEWQEQQVIVADELSKLGETYLDENFPGVLEDVDPEMIQMASGSSCVLGQAFGDYTDGIRAIYNREGGDESGKDRDELGREMGFLENGACYMALDLAWRKRLTGR